MLTCLALGASSHTTPPTYLPTHPPTQCLLVTPFIQSCTPPLVLLFSLTHFILLWALSLFSAFFLFFPFYCTPSCHCQPIHLPCSFPPILGHALFSSIVTPAVSPLTHFYSSICLPTLHETLFYAPTYSHPLLSTTSDSTTDHSIFLYLSVPPLYTCHLYPLPLYQHVHSPCPHSTQPASPPRSHPSPLTAEIIIISAVIKISKVITVRMFIKRFFVVIVKKEGVITVPFAHVNKILT